MSADPAMNAGGAQDGSLPPDPPSLVGRLLADRYRIVAKLGEGAMGAVYLGEHLELGRRDAIKVMRPALAQDREAIARFTRGTRNVSAIRHPNVCAIYDFAVTQDGIRYLAMEYVEGATLKAVLEREGRLRPERAIDIACQMADALQAAHDVGVIHRDLKPGNIMLSGGPRADGREIVKVVDFDISKGAGDPEGEEVTRGGFIVGTPEYMSPEQIIGERLDGRSDLYSLAVVLFRMLTGKLPSRATNARDIMLERLTGTPVRLDELLASESIPGMAGLQHALDRALAREPADRQATTAEFGREIASAGDSAPVPPPPPPVADAESPLTATRIAVGPVTRPSRSRTRVAMSLGVGLTVVAVLGFGAYSWRGRPAPSHVSAHDTTVASQGPTTASRDTTPSHTDTITARTADGGTSQSRAGSIALATVAVDSMLDRQLEALLRNTPTASVLSAARDSAHLALRSTSTRRDSATAFLVLAQVALADGDIAACGKWARLGSKLGIGGSAFASIIGACR